MSSPLLTVGPTSKLVDDDERLLLGRPYNDMPPLDPPSSIKLEEQFFVEWEVAEAS